MNNLGCDQLSCYMSCKSQVISHRPIHCKMLNSERRDTETASNKCAWHWLETSRSKAEQIHAKQVSSRQLYEYNTVIRTFTFMKYAVTSSYYLLTIIYLQYQCLIKCMLFTDQAFDMSETAWQANNNVIRICYLYNKSLWWNRETYVKYNLACFHLHILKL